MSTTNNPRPFGIPDPDFDTIVALVPKGTEVLVKAPIRTRPRSRQIAITAGTFRVAYVTIPKVATVNGTTEGVATYHVLDSTGYPVDLDGEHTALRAPNGDALYYPDEHPADGKPWGWYGLDWTYDPSDDADDADEAGYVRLRRMVKVSK